MKAIHSRLLEKNKEQIFPSLALTQLGLIESATMNDAIGMVFNSASSERINKDKNE